MFITSTQHLQESQNKKESCTKNTKILACCSVFFAYVSNHLEVLYVGDLNNVSSKHIVFENFTMLYVAKKDDSLIFLQAGGSPKKFKVFIFFLYSNYIRAE